MITLFIWGFTLGFVLRPYNEGYIGAPALFLGILCIVYRIVYGSYP